MVYARRGDMGNRIRSLWSYNQIENIICDGYIAWSKEQIDEARKDALSNVGEYVS